MDRADFDLLDRFQRGFPLEARPYAAVGAALGIGEAETMERLERLRREGLVRRVGAVLTPRHLGAGLLVAMAVPRRRVHEVAQQVSALPAVNHNYARSHRLNLWFVVTAPDAARVEETVRSAEALASVAALRLKLVEAYHLDLGFALGGATGETRPARRETPCEPLAPDAAERALIQRLQEGLPLTARPYAELARAAGLTEPEVRRKLAGWIERGTIRRLGVIVDHHRLGYRTNAMVVWDVPDAEVDEVGRTAAATGLTTLCYRRTRAAPQWPYNLYCMLHGKSRAAVRQQLARLVAAAGLDAYASQVLFCVRQYSQRGARYVEDASDGPDRPSDRQPAAGRIPGDGAAVPRDRAALRAV